MEKDAHYFLVGVFVSLTLLGLVGFVIWLVGTHGFNHYDRYTVYFTDPVDGLNEDADVTYKGVDVGKIMSVRLTPGRSDLIKVDIEVKAATPVTGETQARIETQGLTGQSYIQLATPRPGPPPARPEGENYPVLKGTGSRMAKFMDQLPGVADQLQRTLSSIDEFSHSGAHAADSIRDLADVLKKNPAEILRGPPPQGGVRIPK